MPGRVNVVFMWSDPQETVKQCLADLDTPVTKARNMRMARLDGAALNFYNEVGRILQMLPVVEQQNMGIQMAVDRLVSDARQAIGEALAALDVDPEPQLEGQLSIEDVDEGFRMQAASEQPE